MRYILSFLFFYIIFANALTKKIPKEKMVASLRNMNFKESKKKLQQTGVKQHTSVGIVPTISKSRDHNPNTKLFKKSENESISTEIKLDNTEAQEQIRKFHRSTQSKSKAQVKIRKFYNFTQNKEVKNIRFNVYFYFFGRPISFTIILRIKINYIIERNLRNLQEIEAESVPTECQISEKYKEYAGQIRNGAMIYYNCEAPTTSSADVEEAILDTDYSIKLDNQSLSYNMVDFDPDAAEEALNIKETNPYKLIGTLDNYKGDFKKNYLDIKGEPKFSSSLTSINEIPLEFIHYTSKDKYIKKNVTCTVLNENSIRCPGNIRSYLSNISQAKCNDELIDISFNLNPEDETGEMLGQRGHILFRRQSSGLTGGGIAAIVLTCVVVLVAAAMAESMLGKPAPPKDDTTVVNLKTMDNR